MADYVLLESSNMISYKIWVIEKFYNSKIFGLSLNYLEPPDEGSKYVLVGNEEEGKNFLRPSNSCGRGTSTRMYLVVLQ